MLKGKVVVIGVCGGIAAYKAADVISKLKKLNAEVHVIMTHSACEFIQPLTLQALSQNMVVTDMFERPRTWEIEHIALAQKADLFVIVPATANMIGKMANGIADDMLSTTVMAAKCPVIFAPAMNCNMYENAIVQENIEKLKSYDYSFVAPGHGRLACGDIGQGKLADIEDILDTIIDAIAYEKNLKGHKVLVTAGPTREPLDPVRFVTNYSSGKMGYAIAKAARYRGAQVTLITGPTGIAAVKGVKTISVNTALEMYDAVLDYYKEASMIIKAAAVGDYRPLYTSENKIKKSDGNIDLILTKNPDILMELGKRISKQVLIGFSMETQNLEGYAREKLLKKNLDLIVANNLSEQGAGFSVDTNIVTIIDKNGNIDTLPIMAKEQLAHMILDKGLQIYQQKRNIHSD